MKVKKISRKEKELFYIKEETKLQHHWGNPINSDWDFVSNWSDEELKKRIEDTMGQLKFENIKTFIKVVVVTFVLLGIIGLLVFGIKQLF